MVSFSKNKPVDDSFTVHLRIVGGLGGIDVEHDGRRYSAVCSRDVAHTQYLKALEYMLDVFKEIHQVQE